MHTIRKPAPGRSTIALIGAFALAFVHQYLFYGQELGISYPLFVLLLYVYFFHDWRGRLRGIPGIGWFVLAVVLMLSLTFALFRNPFFHALNLLVVPGLFFLHMACVRGSNRAPWWDARIVGEALNHLFPRSLSQLPTPFRILRATAFRRLRAKRKSTLNKVLIGLLVAAPLLVVVVPLLASADGVFNRLLNGIPDWTGRLLLDELFARALWVAILGLLLFAYFWGFARPKRGKQPMKGEEIDGRTGRERAVIDPVVLTTALIAVNAVYVLFAAVQFSYLFGAGDGALPDGTTYAEYARSGFFELVAVSAINFGLLIVSLHYGGALRRAVAALLYVLVACSGVMLCSAYLRLALYESAYGYTYIRFLVHAFMIYLAILLLIAAIRIRTPLLPLSKCCIVLSLAAYVLVNYAGMDRWIAEKNIERFEETGRIDREYLGGLSADAVPTLVRFASDYGDAEMGEILERRIAESADGSRDWRSYNAADESARKTLNEWRQRQ
ncbi:DUF4153 domain-containing protein [Paenibacillaceae bacterium WGS1546]|uniref:DUF4153 domain-containing protein n=1 Tax=Cohnella sp. WGS1546 TaxID=3366810 RepID=UPI00372D0152